MEDANQSVDIFCHQEHLLNDKNTIIVVGGNDEIYQEYIMHIVNRVQAT